MSLINTTRYSVNAQSSGRGSVPTSGSRPWLVLPRSNRRLVANFNLGGLLDKSNPVHLKSKETRTIHGMKEIDQELWLYTWNFMNKMPKAYSVERATCLHDLLPQICAPFISRAPSLQLPYNPLDESRTCLQRPRSPPHPSGLADPTDSAYTI